jgi:phage terminase small subunit
MAKRAAKSSVKKAGVDLDVGLKRFADEWLVDQNGVRAWKASHPDCQSDGSAAVSASRALRLPKVAAYVEKRLARLEITSERILAEYAKLAFSDPRQVAKWGPSGVELLPSSELDDDAAASIAEVSSKSTEFGVETKFKMHDKKGALDALAKIRGMFVEKHEHNVRLSFEDMVIASATGVDE